MSKIVIIDDDKNLVYALTTRLKSSGYQVVPAYDPVVGLSVIVHEKPDAILLDMNMPGGGGILMIQRIMKHPNLDYIPIIVITGTRDPEVFQQCKELGIEHYFEKPFDTQKLLEALKIVTESKEKALQDKIA